MKILWLSDAPSRRTVYGRVSGLLCPAIQACGHSVSHVAFGHAGPSVLWRDVEIYPFFEELEAQCTAADILNHYFQVVHPEILITFTDLARVDFLGQMAMRSRPVKWLNWFTLESGDSRAMLDTLCPAAHANFVWTEQDLRQALNVTSTVSVLPIPRETGEGQSGEGTTGGEHTTELDECVTSLLPLLKRVRGPVPNTGLTSAQPRGVHEDIRINLKYHPFTSSSLSHTMQELTYALHRVGCEVSVEPAFGPFGRPDFRNEIADYQRQNPERHETIVSLIDKAIDPRDYWHVGHVLFDGRRDTERYCHLPGAVLSLRGPNVNYTTGNHVVDRDVALRLRKLFSAVWVPSQHLAQAYLDGGFPAERLFVIPHGIDEGSFCSTAQPTLLPADRGFTFLQWSFPWVHEKGFDIALEAFCTEFRRGEDVLLLIKSPYVDGRTGELETLVQEWQERDDTPEVVLDTSCTALPARAGWYTACDCYVHPTRAEGFGMTVLEAMACGLPAIVTDWSGPADFCTNENSFPLRHTSVVPAKTGRGHVARYFAEPDKEHLRTLMRYVFENREEARQAGSKASSDVRRNWTWTVAAYKVINAIHDLSRRR